MTTTAHEDQYAPEPVSGDPVFETRAEFYAWTAQTVREATTPTKMIDALDRIRRVTIAHLHLRDAKADSDGGGA